MNQREAKPPRPKERRAWERRVVRTLRVQILRNEMGVLGLLVEVER